MSPEELSAEIQIKLNKRLPAHIFLDRMRVIEEASRNTASYNDPRYIPFYYWLGTLIKPQSLVEIGFKLGLLSGNFFWSCKTIKNFLAFQEKTKDYYSARLGLANIRSGGFYRQGDHYKGPLKIHVGAIYDENFVKWLEDGSWDVAFINEEVGYDKHKAYLDLIWSKLNRDGLIVMDYINFHQPAKDAYFDFCRLMNRKPVVVPTRYGVGLIQK